MPSGLEMGVFLRLAIGVQTVAEKTAAHTKPKANIITVVRFSSPKVECTQRVRENVYEAETK